MNILGTNYEIINDESLNNDCDGICCTYSKQLRIRPLDDMLTPEDGTVEKIKRHNEVLRHEITHAFLFESGLEELCDNEMIVDWIAKQYPKMARAFREIACAEE